MKRIAIVGAGQSGLLLALGLLGAGCEVTLYSDRSAQEIHDGHVMSSQCMFDSALEIERNLKLNYWEEECPRVEGIAFTVPDGVGGKSLDWAARLDDYAQSVDQRLKIPRWMAEFQERGGNLQICAVGVEELESCARSHDLVIVASGRGSLGGVFQRDPSRSAYAEPQRALALTYVRNLRPRRPYPAVCFNLIPNVGEYFVFPALTTSGPCEIMVFEGVPGGPMDCWDGVKTPADHLACSKRILQTFMPWEAERCAEV
ncbi:MAG TPA: styrene monooxygenase/indole monooxygenase family protein, partial [Terriglobales bacterium]|nr:styrene monooxygenase/indole monooxygenase family protein [Terriglobales bacterium]